MTRKSLKWQLGLLAAIPFLFFAAFSLRDASRAWSTYKEARTAQKNLLLVEAASELAHEAQIERGVSSLYLSGGASDEDLHKQYTVLDQKLSIFQTRISETSLSETMKAELEKLGAANSTVRALVTAKQTPASAAIASYTAFIRSLLNSEIKVAELTDEADVKITIYSLAILEEAKEGGGKLRANMSATLSTDQPINEERFALFVHLKGSVDGNLRSPALVLSDEAKKQLAAFEVAPEWQEVNRVYKLILVKAEQGHYGEDPKSFFKSITVALNLINQVVKDQVHFGMQKSQELKTASERTLTITLSIFVLALLGLSWISVRTINQLAAKLMTIASHLENRTDEVATAASAIAASSTQLSDSASQQAAALQETVAAVEQINAMVEKNAEATTHSLTIAKRSQEASRNGQSAVAEVRQAMGRIDAWSGQVIQQSTDANAQLTSIASVISEIGTKTNVINEIVFQTKLLSFNASVEAARAGEHGRGFSVVAEEIGKLAKVSGSAAQDIAELLAKSTARVTAAAEDSTAKVNELAASKQREMHGVHQTVEKCDQALEEILLNVASVNERVTEIAAASVEQAKGLEEVNKAMQLIDQAAQQNSSAANDASRFAGQLNEESEALGLEVKNLTALVKGRAFVAKPQEAASGSTADAGEQIPLPSPTKFKAAA